MSKDVFVLMEQRDGELAKVGIELIGEATKLAADLGQKVVAVLLGSDIKNKAEVCIQPGRTEILRCNLRDCWSVCLHFCII